MPRFEDDDAFEAPVDLSPLRRQTPVPEGLEDRVVQRLRTSGELATLAGRSERRRAPRWLAPLAAALVGMALGWWAHPDAPATSTTTRAQTDDGRLFLLMFSGGPQAGEGLTRSVLASRDWARSVAAGRLVAAQRLLPSGRVLTRGDEMDMQQPRVDDFTPTGFFVIRARSFDEAVELARTNPHLSLGGHLTVRPIDDLRWLPAATSGRESGSAPS